MRAPFQILAIPYRLYPSRQYCLLRRADCGKWQFVAGGGEDGETPKEAAVREIREETGAEPRSLTALVSTACLPVNVISEELRGHWERDTYVIPEYCFAFEWPSDIKLSGEHLEYRWLGYDDAVRLLEWDSNKTALYELNCLLTAAENEV